MKTLAFILLASPSFAQLDTARVYFATESMIPVTQSQIFVTAEPLPVLLEPNGKRMEYTITVKEVAEFQYVDNPTYVGSWNPITDNRFYNSTYSYSFKLGDYIELTFTGSKIEWFSQRAVDHGRSGITVDNETEVIIPPFSAELPIGIDYILNRPTFTKSFPESGLHKIRVRVMDSNKAILHDFFRITL